MSVKHSVGAATLLENVNGNQNFDEEITYLIHILAKQATPMKQRRTVLGRVPARLKILVIRTRSMFVLLRADAIVKPPIRSIIVGENITEKINLRRRAL